MTLFDGADSDAAARRQATRPAHLDDAGRPVGSFLLADCADRAELDAMIANDPYRKANVWQTVDVKPARLVLQYGKITP